MTTALSDREWKRFLPATIVDVLPPLGILSSPKPAASRRTTCVLTRDDGTTKNISPIDKTNIHCNKV